MSICTNEDNASEGYLTPRDDIQVQENINESSLAQDNENMEDSSSKKSVSSDVGTSSSDGSKLPFYEIHPPREKKPAVVVVRNANKSYGYGNHVLRGYNMTVEKGSIYGLLGSSGCGKSTILTCLVGVRQLDSGVIRVFGNKPGTREAGVPGKNIGYMPQDISLYGDFTINETLIYFGSLYCMPKETISKNRKWLINFLALGDPKRRVASLSGGQKRRVSIAVAMIHDPPLLILDEPTVGVDPLLRESIWEHLIERVSKNNTTVIITTHYIEEAKRSDMIGLMRNGKLLDEKPPAQLLHEHNATLLEDVVLKLCKGDTDESQLPKNSSVVRKAAWEIQQAHSSSQPTSKEFEANPQVATIENNSGNSVLNSLKRVMALAHKNAMVLLRNYLLLIFMIVVPASQVFIICLVTGDDPKDLNFGIVNHELPFNNVNNCNELMELEKNDTCSLIGLSCEFSQLLPKDIINQKFYKSEESAREAVRKGKTWGFMSIPEEFSSAYFAKVATSHLVDEDTLNSSKITLEMDDTNLMISNTFKLHIGRTFQMLTTKMLIDCGYSARSGDSPIKFAEPIYGSMVDTDMREFMSPGLLVGVLLFFPLITAAIQYIREKRMGTLERTLVTGVKTWEIMTGFSITITLVLLIQTILGLVIITFVYDIEIHGSFILCVLLCSLMGLTGVSMGFLIGSICKEEVEATMLSIALFFPVLMLSGVMWPVEGMSKGFQYVSYILPCAYPSASMRSLISRGWSFNRVWPGYLATVCWIAFCWFSNMFLQKNNLTR